MRHCTAALLLALPLAAAAEPLVVTHQGYLLGTNDVPLEEPALALSFRLYNRLQPNDSAEQLVWESRSCPTQVRGGRYSVVLGDSCNGDVPLATEHLPAAQARFLEISIAGERLLPRLALTAAPVAASARNAEKLGGLDLAALDARYEARFAPIAGSSSSGYALLNPTTPQTGNLKVTGTVSAGEIAADTLLGNGAGITGLSAAQLTTGLLPDARFSGTYTGALTFSNAQNAFTGLGAGLTGVNAAKLGGLTLEDLDDRYARVSGGTGGAVSFAGAIKFGNGETTCNAAAAGTIRWDGSNFLGCDGSEWRQLNNQPPPKITSLLPNVGSTLGGGVVTITGTHFSPGATVLIGDVPARDLVFVSQTTVRVTVPPGTAGAKAVKMVNADNQAFTLNDAFTYVNGVYSYSGNDQAFTVPPGVTQITAKLWGAGGGGGRVAGIRGGAGGYTTGTLAVQAGQTYVLVVGQGGRRSATTSHPAGVGGGLSGIFLGSVSQANARLIAGGGGGGAYYNDATWGSSGGNGGGLVGGDGAWPGSSYYDSRGRGGTQSGGGAGGIYSNGYAGSSGTALQGGVGGIYSGGTVTSGSYGGGGGSGGGVSYDSGGGGGGYWGGGGGSNNAPLGGGGGSGFVASTGVTNGSTVRGDTPGVPPATDDPHYATGIAYGGNALSSVDGGHGRIVLSW